MAKVNKLYKLSLVHISDITYRIEMVSIIKITGIFSLEHPQQL